MPLTTPPSTANATPSNTIAGDAIVTAPPHQAITTSLSPCASLPIAPYRASSTTEKTLHVAGNTRGYLGMAAATAVAGSRLDATPGGGGRTGCCPSTPAKETPATLTTRASPPRPRSLNGSKSLSSTSDDDDETPAGSSPAPLPDDEVLEKSGPFPPPLPPPPTSANAASNPDSPARSAKVVRLAEPRLNIWVCTKDQGKRKTRLSKDEQSPNNHPTPKIQPNLPEQTRGMEQAPYTPFHISKRCLRPDNPSHYPPRQITGGKSQGKSPAANHGPEFRLPPRCRCRTRHRCRSARRRRCSLKQFRHPR